MGKVVEMDSIYDHVLCEAVCIKCLHRFLDVYPIGSFLKNLECPGCGETGYLIDTGEVIDDITYDKVVDKYPDFVIYRKRKLYYQY